MIRYLLMICLALGLGLGGLAFTQSACASKKMSCHRTAPSSGCCCKKKQARICSCDHSAAGQPAAPPDNGKNELSVIAALLGQLAVLGWLLARSVAPVFFSSTEGRARGPTSLGLNAFQIALPPPA